jgi:tRNA A37 N6-isopentenylltransferase MiaA
MRKNLLLTVIIFVSFFVNAQSYETQFAKPLSQVLQEISSRFNVKLKYDADTTGKVVTFADFRIRPYSVEESLTNVLSLFDYKFAKQDDKTYKIKVFEYPRRTPEDGAKLLAYLNTLYKDSALWNLRRATLKKEVRERLKIDSALSKRVQTKPILSKIRKYDGYSVQNFALETLPGLYVNGSIYTPLSKGKHALILCPNGHWGGGRYNSDEQTRFGTLARMGAVCVSYDLFGWGESALQVTGTAHRTSVAHILQIMNGITILDYMLTRKDIDPKRVGANGGSGGGSQVVLLSVLDDRFAAVCPTVSLASHFDGGCPCESGMPIQLAGGGTCNAELLATFAPKPVCVVSDGGDWTATVPELEYPYLQRIFGFYNAQSKLSNVHLPNEKHDFGVNKRKAVYEFFIRTFALNAQMLDESKVTIEPEKAMYSFGDKGEKMPANAIREFKQVERMFDKKADAKIHSDIDLEKRAQSYVDSLKLNDKEREIRVYNVIRTHMRAVRDWHNEHPFTTVPAGINPRNGEKLTDVHRDVIACSAKPKSVHENLMTGLRKDLTEQQVETILDLYTIGKYHFTLKGFKAIVPDMKEKEEDYVVQQLRLAREQAVDYKTMKGEISAIFEIYKDNVERYFNENGRNWRKMYKIYTDKLKAEKESKKKAEAEKK